MAKVIYALIIVIIVGACSPILQQREVYAPTLEQYQAYLPLVLKQHDNLPGRLGGHWWFTVYPDYIITTQWIRYTVNWDTIEPEPGQYIWPTYLDQAMQFFHSNQNPVMINFHRTPAWARSNEWLCYMPDTEHIDDFANFVIAVIDRYSPRVVEIGNEVEHTGIVSSTLYWCCGCGTPQEYTNVLNYVYDRVHAERPDVLVAGGSLLSTSSTWTNDWFLTGPKMDILTFHRYMRYGKPLTTDAISLDISNLHAKTDKPLWLDETSVTCNPITQDCGDDFRQQQAEWLRIVNGVDGINKIFWFPQNYQNWLETDMCWPGTQTTYPVFDVFRELIEGIY